MPSCNHSLPTWAALWFLAAAYGHVAQVWTAVGRIAETWGYPKFPSERNEPEVILEIGAEGGSITLYGIPHGTGWRYSTSVVDSTLSFVSDEPKDSEYRRDSKWVQSWDAALRLIDRNPWHRLYALTVHPEFRERVWAAISSG